MAGLFLPFRRRSGR